MPKLNHYSTIVVGGGWAGLAAASKLAKKSKPLLLLESAKQLGGRARRVSFEKQSVDNGQHMLLGAYEHTLQLLEELGLNEADLFVRRPLSLCYKGINGHQDFAIHASSFLPAPLHIACAILFSQGLSLTQRLSALLFTSRLYINRFRLKKDISVALLLKKNHQSPRLIEALWEPLCLGALNTPIEQASAEIFLEVLKHSFARKQHFSDLLLTKKDLSTMLPDPATLHIEKNQGQVMLARKVTAISLHNGKVKGVTTIDGEITCDNIILATPPHVSQQLLAAHPQTASIAEELGQLQHQPVCTVYLQYPEEVKLERENIGLLGSTSQWLFDRAIYEQAGLIAVVISGEGGHMQKDNQTLIQSVLDEIRPLYPHWPKPNTTMVIREKRATFSCSVGCNQYRPAANTNVEGLYLAGDYVATKLPATLEGAVISGVQCATYINNKDFV